MGAQWKQAGRVEHAAKRGAIIGKLVKEIMVAAKLGGADPDLNARLYAAVEAAKKASVPRDTLDRAIKRGAGLTDEKINYEQVTYEGFAPHKVAMIVECLTDNKNRTAADVRHMFSKKGQLGTPGSVTWMFDHWGVVEAVHPEKSRDPEEAAIEAGAQNVEALEAAEVPEGHLGARFYCDRQALDVVSKLLAKAGWKVQASEMRFVAKNFLELPADHRKEVMDFLHEVDEHDDVHHIYAAIK